MKLCRRLRLNLQSQAKHLCCFALWKRMDVAQQGCGCLQSRVHYSSKRRFLSWYAVVVIMFQKHIIFIPCRLLYPYIPEIISLCINTSISTIYKQQQQIPTTDNNKANMMQLQLVSTWGSTEEVVVLLRKHCRRNSNVQNVHVSIYLCESALHIFIYIIIHK